ncbi:MAG: type II toxin-antitoxin system VapC family toxin [Alphaproteobacteria bacterium]
MILLDTNVISEGIRPKPDANVQAWMDAQRQGDLFLCTPVLAELFYGIERLPKGARRNHLEQVVLRIEATFGDRVLGFDRSAAVEYGRLVGQRDRIGRATSTTDGLIAAIARASGATLATRDTHGFNDLGIDLLNPFEFAG